MAVDERISIEITDKVAGSIATKLAQIERNARSAYSAVQDLQKGLTGLSGGASTTSSAISGLNVNVSNFNKTVNNTSNVTNNATNNVNNYGVSLRGLTSVFGLGTVAGTAFATSLALVGKSMIDATEQTGPLLNRLKLVTDSTAQAEKTFQDLYKVGQEARVNFIELGQTYQTIARSGREMGTSQKDLLRVTETIAKSLTISGTSAASAQAALVQLSQGFASGTLRGEELNSVLEQTPRLAQAIADGMGVSVGQLRKMGEQGELTGKRVMDALVRASQTVDEEFAKMGTTVSGELTKMTNATTVFWSELDKVTGVSARVAQGIGGITRAVEGMTNALRDNKQEVAGSRIFAQFSAPGAFTNIARILGQDAGRRLSGRQTAPLNLTPQNDVFNIIDNAQGFQRRANTTSEKFLNGGKYLTDAEELKKKLKELDTAFAEVDKNADTYSQSLAAYNARRKELIDDANKSANRSANAAAAKAQRLELAQEKQIADWRLENLNNLGKQAKAEMDAANAVRAYTDALNASNNARAIEIQQQVEMLSMGDNQREQYQRLIAVQNEYQQKLEQITAQRTTNKLTQEQFDAEKAALETWLSTRVQMEQDATAQINAARSDWVVGATRAISQYQDSALNASITVGEALTNSFKTAEDALVSFTTTGKFSFSSFADSIISDLARIAARQAVSGLVGALAGSFFGSVGDMTGRSVGGVYGAQTQAGLDSLIASKAGYGSGGYTGNGGVNDVAGVVHGQEFVFDAASTAYYGADNLARMMNAAGSGTIGAGGAAQPPVGIGGTQVHFTVINNAGVQVTQREEQDDQGNTNITVLLDQLEDGLANRVASGRGKMNKAIGSAFGLRQNANVR